MGGKYRLARKIAEGGMGSVWIATNLLLDAKVAIKLLNTGVRSPEAVERFLREARSAAMLNHPGIVRIFDLGATGEGDPFIVMELLAGESLCELLDRVTALSPERAVQILLPVAAAMHVAHEHGVIHRDLKPENIMIAPSYGETVEVRVVDFGVAKLAFAHGGRANTGASVIGTPEYMSPEQARGLGVVDRRADVWSLAVVLYETLAGHSPFARDAISATLIAVSHEEARPLGVDEALWRIVERGLRKDPEQRFPTMRAFGEALAAWLRSRGVSEDACGLSLRAYWLAGTSARQTRQGIPRPSVLLAGVRRHAAILSRDWRRTALVGLAVMAGLLGLVTGFSLVPDRDAVAQPTAPSALPSPGPRPERPVADRRPAGR